MTQSKSFYLIAAQNRGSTVFNAPGNRLTLNVNYRPLSAIYFDSISKQIIINKLTNKSQ
jgi:hypothetical protein